MKKTNRILHWLTLFVASIGVCAFLSVCFILIYPKIFQGNSPKEKGVSSPVAIGETHIGDSIIALEKSNTMPEADEPENVLSDTHTGKTIESAQDKNMNEDWKSEEQDIAKSSVSEDTGTHAVPDENAVDATQPNSEYQMTAESPEESSEEIAYIPEPPYQDNTVEPAVKPAGASENNYNTYDNEAQQQVDDLYVLNTSSMKIHHKTCNGVKKIAPQNYSTSNASIEELIEQGYSRCGICFK